MELAVAARRLANGADGWPMRGDPTGQRGRTTLPAVAHPFTHAIRVRYGECDPQGVVFNANWLGYFDVVITELWRDRVGDYSGMIEAGADMMVAEANVRFLGPARFDDVVDFELTVTRLGETALGTRIDASVEARSEEHTSELQSHSDLVCRLLLEKKKTAILALAPAAKAAPGWEATVLSNSQTDPGEELQMKVVIRNGAATDSSPVTFQV